MKITIQGTEYVLDVEAAKRTFAVPRTLKEIANYLKENNMVFSHNCSAQIKGWSRKPA